MDVLKFLSFVAFIGLACVIYYCRDWRKIAEEEDDLVKIEQDGQ